MELSIDGGRTWEPVDKIEQVPDKKSGMYWSWALWEKHVPWLDPTSELVVRACKLFWMSRIVCFCFSRWRCWEKKVLLNMFILAMVNDDR